MKRIPFPALLGGLFVLGGAAPVLSPPPAGAMCIPFDCPDCNLRSAGQVNWLILDPDGRHVGLIPNVRLQGEASDFGLVVPTPSVPDLVPVPVGIWAESFGLTAPATIRGDQRGGLGCGPDQPYTQPLYPGDSKDVGIVVQKTVGEFDVTVLAASDSQALVDWLNQNGFAFDPEDVARFTPYVEAGWVFTAMHLTEGAEVPVSWDTNVDPVLFTFETDTVRIPLPLLAIHRNDTFPMAFFVLAGHRVDLPGFTTQYANRLSPDELAAIGKRYPTLGSFLTAGRFVTRLDRTFLADDPMDQDLVLARAGSDTEFRRVSRGVIYGGFPAGMGLLIAAFWVGRSVERRRRRRSLPT